MENSVQTFFEWKLKKCKSVEDTYKDIYGFVAKWDRRDVLYSFIGIYQIGIYSFYPEECRRTDYKIMRKDGKYFDLKYLVSGKKPRYSKYDDLNKAIEKSELIDVIDSVGNVIPVWPGGNTDRGTKAYCFDIPDIYFCYKYKKWYEKLCELYPEAFLDELFCDEYAIGTKDFLDKMKEPENYKRFLMHAVTVIKNRTEKLKQNLQ